MNVAFSEYMEVVHDQSGRRDADVARDVEADTDVKSAFADDENSHLRGNSVGETMKIIGIEYIHSEKLYNITAIE